MTTIIYAGGFNDYEGKTDAEELLDSAKGKWAPGTPDFLQTANDSGTRDIWSADDDGEFLGVLTSHSKPIKRLVFIGHGSPFRLGLSGSQQGRFSKSLGKDSLTKQVFKQHLPKVKWGKDARFDIFACNTGLGGEFLQALADAFRIPVQGYEGAIWWCLGHDQKNRKITSRGRISSRSGPGGQCHKKPWVQGIKNMTPPVAYLPSNP